MTRSTVHHVTEWINVTPPYQLTVCRTKVTAILLVFRRVNAEPVSHARFRENVYGAG
jgi:hypothetical protein